jgi:hypothetical protein
VRDDVVELARDPDSLFRNRGSRLLLTLAFEIHGEPLERPLAVSAVADRATGQPGASEDHCDEKEVSERVLSCVGGDQRCDAERSDRRMTPLRVRPDRVGGDCERDGRGGRGLEHGHNVRDYRHGNREGEDGERRSPPPGEGERQDEADCGRERSFSRRVNVASEVARRVRRIDRPYLDLEEDGEAEGKRPVAVRPEKPRERHANDASAVVAPLRQPRERSLRLKDGA